MIQTGQLFKEIIRYDEAGYLISGSTPGEDRFNPDVLY